MPGKNGKLHHRGTYGRQSQLVRDAANANPATICWRCHRTLDQIPPHKTGRRAHWTAGHVNDGEVNGELRPECSPCSAETGARHGNRLREPHSEDW